MTESEDQHQKKKTHVLEPELFLSLLMPKVKITHMIKMKRRKRGKTANTNSLHSFLMTHGDQVLFTLSGPNYKF